VKLPVFVQVWKLVCWRKGWDRDR